MTRTASLHRILLSCIAILLLSGCRSIVPVRSVPAANQADLFTAPTYQPTLPAALEATPTSQAVESPSDCVNLLQFIPPDVTYPDGSEVKPGETLDKQWQVKNTGTCNWGSGYTLRLTGGEDMGAASPQALVPARNGTETIISIIFTAPETAGAHTSSWKAYSPEGQPFGDLLYIDIFVADK